MGSKLLVFIFFLIPITGFSQDYFVENNSDTTFCIIDGIESGKIYFRLKGQETDLQEKIRIYDCSAISVTDKSKIHNKKSVEILDTPKDEVLIYLIRPGDFINSAMNCRVKCNNLLLTALKNNSFCVLTLKPGDLEFYWLSKGKRSVKINGVAGETYFIKCEQTGGVGIGVTSNGMMGAASSLDFELSLLNKEIGEMAVKQVKKESIKEMKVISDVVKTTPVNLKYKNK